MKYFIVIGLIWTSIISLGAQSWQYISDTSDYYGIYTAATLSGRSVSGNYEAPKIVILKLAEDGLKFRLQNIDSELCGDISVYFVFDGIRRYCATTVYNDYHKVLTFKEFYNANIFSQTCGDVELSQYQIYSEIMNSNKLGILIENECDPRQYIFMLDGASASLNRLFGLGVIDAHLALHNLYNRISKQSDSVFHTLNNDFKYLKAKRELFHRIDFFHSIDGVNYLDFFSMSFEDIALAYDLTSTFSSDVDVRFTYYNGNMSIRYAVEGYYTDHSIGYSLNLVGDSLRLSLNEKQRRLEMFLKENEGSLALKALRFVRDLDIDSLRLYLDIAQLTELGEIVKSESKICYIKRDSEDPTSGQLCVKNKEDNEYKILAKLPLIFEDKATRISRLRQINIRDSIVKDSIRVWQNTPDFCVHTFGWEEISEKPTTNLCDLAEVCISDLLTGHIRTYASKRLLNSVKSCTLKLNVDYFGSVTVVGISGLNGKLTRELDNILSSLERLSSPRFNGKICQVEFSINLNHLNF